MADAPQSEFSMILTCTSCATRYFAPDDSIPPQGRTVRCAACGTSWRAERELVLDNTAEEALTLVQDEPQLTREQIERARKAAGAGASPTAQARARQQQRQKLEKLRSAATAWAGIAGVAALVLVLAVVFRQGVAKIWPNTASAYAMVGLNVNITGLEFSDLQITRSIEPSSPSITIAGSVRNIGGKARKPPVLRFGLRDHNGDEVKSWLTSLAGAEIPPGGARQFKSTLSNPPVSAVDIEATFATASEAKKAPPPEIAHAISEAVPTDKAHPKSAGSKALTIIEPEVHAKGSPMEPGQPAQGFHPDGH
jgi:predicted Zn finger-like uncharacterized protein